MKIVYKLFISSLLIVAMFLIAGFSINMNVLEMSNAHEDLIKAVKIDNSARDYLAGARAMQVGVYLSFHGDKELGRQLMKEGTDKMAESRNDLRKSLTELQKSDMLASVSEAERLEEKAIKASTDVINNVDNKALAEQNLITLQGSVQALELKLKDLEDSADKDMNRAMNDAQTHSRNTTQATYIGILAALLISLLLSFGMASLMTRPLRTLTDVANRVSKGEIQTKVTVTSNDEIGELAESFKRMVNAFKIMDALSREK